MKDSPYFKQAVLMVKTIPHVAAENCFAVKGGTAINLFVRNLPRLSVDIDLTYLPVDEPRDIVLPKISEALARISNEIKKTIAGARVQETRVRNPDRITRLTVSVGPTRTKIEANEVIRGAVFPAEERELTPRAENMFELSVTARTLSLADLYGGKFCAALDRQHPRDLFDVLLLFQNEGITDEIRKAFVVYLASHDRPMHELLNPSLKNVRRIYDNEFTGMTLDPVAYEDLIAARDRLVETLREQLTNDEREFLVSLKAGEPKWQSIGIAGVEKLPALQWKLTNIQRLEVKKQRELLEKLKRVLEM
ncbi:MAG: nucleotidyl transferase AbiEii/AbiGii toxin family protein [Deltaproteobacteria bacterium]|nr:nucleotidyl transferase AbiEii/AbiGii toxin family protein [Deltaproteobacteria bacterium]